MKRDKALEFFRNEIEEIEAQKLVPLDWLEDFKEAFAALASEPEPLAVVEWWLNVCTKTKETAKNAALKPDRLSAAEVFRVGDWVSIPVTATIHTRKPNA